MATGIVAQRLSLEAVRTELTAVGLALAEHLHDAPHWLRARRAAQPA